MPQTCGLKRWCELAPALATQEVWAELSTAVISDFGCLTFGELQKRLGQHSLSETHSEWLWGGR